MAPRVKPFAVTVNWNRPDDTIECGRSILSSGYDGIGPAVVDNGSVDGSAEKIRTAVPEAHIIESPTNEGYVKGVIKGNRLVLSSEAPTS